jgi:hypothetical protein
MKVLRNREKRKRKIRNRVSEARPSGLRASPPASSPSCRPDPWRGFRLAGGTGQAPPSASGKSGRASRTLTRSGNRSWRSSVIARRAATKQSSLLRTGLLRSARNDRDAIHPKCASEWSRAASCPKPLDPVEQSEQAGLVRAQNPFHLMLSLLPQRLAVAHFLLHLGGGRKHRGPDHHGLFPLSLQGEGGVRVIGAGDYPKGPYPLTLTLSPR